MRDRAQSWERLEQRAFDLLVIGGGIVGAAIAAEAAHAGLDVALVERGDFGSATSSSSSKLVHGGLRYLRMGDLRLVGEAHHERRALLRVAAPHLVRRVPFLVPLYRDGPFRPTSIRLAPERARRSVPDLRLAGLRACGIYRDAATNDARLCLANVRAAAEAGATVLNYAEVTALRILGGRVAGAEVLDRETGETVSIAARTVVNACGPWVDRLRRLEDPGASRSYRLSKGAHVLVPQPEGWTAALTIFQDEVRVSFAVPTFGMLLLGTTDEAFDADPDEVAPTEDDVSQILAEAGRAIVDDVLRPELVRFAFAGLRVLPGEGDDTASARRETVITTGPAGIGRDLTAAARMCRATRLPSSSAHRAPS